MDTSSEERRPSILRSWSSGARAMTTPQEAAATARTVVGMDTPIAKRSCRGTTPSQWKWRTRAVEMKSYQRDPFHREGPATLRTQERPLHWYATCNTLDKHSQRRLPPRRPHFGPGDE